MWKAPFKDKNLYSLIIAILLFYAIKMLGLSGSHRSSPYVPRYALATLWATRDERGWIILDFCRFIKGNFYKLFIPKALCNNSKATFPFVPSSPLGRLAGHKE